MILFSLSFLTGSITTYLVIRKKHFKVLKLDYIHPRARMKFSGDYQQHLGSVQEKLQYLPQVVFCSRSMKPSESCIPVMPLCFEMLQKKKYFPPHLFPGWLVRKSFCFVPCAEPHVAYFCCVEICKNKTGCY